MTKQSRLLLIATLVTGGIAHTVKARPEEVKEEVSLASRANDDNSILDDDAIQTASKELLTRIDNEGEGRIREDDYLLNAKERKELARVKVKVAAPVAIEEDTPPEVLDLEELAKWADQVAPVEVAN